MVAGELWLIYALVFGAVLLVVQVAYWVLLKDRGERKRINRRLALTTEFADPAEVLQILRKERGVDVLTHVPSLQKFKEVVVQSGVRFTARVLFLWFGVPAMLFYFLLTTAFGLNFLAIALAVPLSAAFFY